MSRISVGKRSAFGALFAASIAVMAMPGTAVAAVEGHEATNPTASPPAGVTCSIDGWVKACFEPYGDVMWVKDTKADGYPARVYFYGYDGADSANEKQSCLNRHGADAGWTTCTLSSVIPEDDQVIFWPMEVYGADYNHMLPESGGTITTALTS
ncbi:hypothetical protein [Streptomyces luteolus]|uniref:Secreted protein n=1 Tax=Streptomyces luteolus TaxID=3043615 RepID=A0ABT6SW05_9ACTN|nr:hypothetical protein [Streptomyces sp. B-S-A12]MDI3419789.1 hypothetical protein [Streptomyces sp. B-S-A12]